jgi:hypothetical protein
MSDTSPPKPSPDSQSDQAVESQGAGSQHFDALNVPVKSTKAVDIIHFFTGVNHARGKSKEQTPQKKICKICSYVQTLYYLSRFLTTTSEKYGPEPSTLPEGIANYTYGPKTGNTNLRRHLYNIHAAEYDAAVVLHNWPVKLSTQTRDPSTQNPRLTRDSRLPSFSPSAFLEHLVRFVAADDQVSPNNLTFFRTPKFSVNSRCRMPRVSAVVFGPLRDSRGCRHSSP